MKTEIEQLIKSFNPEAGWSTTTHVCVPIKTALELLAKGTNLLSCTKKEAKVELESELGKGKEYFCGCDNQKPDGSCAGHKKFRGGDKPILIGDVLEKIDLRNVTQKDCLLLIVAWKKCGANKSLQEIYAEAEWEVRVMSDFTQGFSREFIPKQPAIRELFELLLQLGL